ncbi:hypothetical protein Tco_1396787, partial [Tanacetum coccineum]
MFKLSTIFDDDSAALVLGGVNGFVKVSLSNSAFSSLFGSSTFVERIGVVVVSLFGEVLGEGASLSIKVEERNALVVFGGSRVATEMGVDTTLGGGLTNVEAAWFCTSPELMCLEVNPRSSSPEPCCLEAIW